MDMGSLTCAQMSVCAAYPNGGQTQTESAQELTRSDQKINLKNAPHPAPPEGSNTLHSDYKEFWRSNHWATSPPPPTPTLYISRDKTQRRHKRTQDTVRFSSVQFKVVSMRQGKPICAPPRLSGISPALPLEQFPCWSDARRSLLLLINRHVHSSLSQTKNAHGEGGGRQWKDVGEVIDNCPPSLKATTTY